MIIEIQKDITTVDYGIIAQGVNCQYKQNSGVAKAIREKWPIVYELYMARPTNCSVVGAFHSIFICENLYVCNLYTQEFYGYDGLRYADIIALESCLVELHHFAQIMQLPIFLPRIGSDRGGLDWDTEVFPLINNINEQFDNVDVTICNY